MGIAGLLPFLKNSCRKTSLDEFRGQTVAVDASCWLHKGAFACADKLAKNEKTDAYIRYCIKYVKLLLSHQMHVILVFDGASLPAKKRTNELRSERRKIMKAKGKRLLAEGKNAEAYEYFKQSAEITFAMISDVIRACTNLPNVDWIVAPYESDAQLAYLNMKNVASLVITEDSDLVLFGCTNIMFKMDINGYGDLYEKQNFCEILKTAQYRMDFVKFRRCCILSGCDYFEGLEGVGLVKAVKFFKKTSRDDLRKILPLIGLYLQMPYVKIDKKFIDNFINAEHTFLYQPVFDTHSKTRVPLTSRPANELAELYKREKTILNTFALEMAIGNANPHTGVAVNAFKPSQFGGSIWSCDFHERNFSRLKNNDSEITVEETFAQKSSFETTISRVIKIKRKSIKDDDESDSETKKSKTSSFLEEYTSISDIPVISRYFVNNKNSGELLFALEAEASNSDSQNLNTSLAEEENEEDIFVESASFSCSDSSKNGNEIEEIIEIPTNFCTSHYFSK